MLRRTVDSYKQTILNNLVTFRKGAKFTTSDVYPVLDSLDAKNASNRLGELVDQGLISRLSPGNFVVTSTVRERKTLTQ